MKLTSINPATGQIIQSYDEHTQEGLENIVHQAKSAFLIWHRLPFKERAVKMKAMAAALQKNRALLAQLMANEMGKPLKQGEGEIDKCAWVCEFYADTAAAFLADEPVATDAQKSYVHFSPLGTVLAVMPWNYPFWQVYRCAAPILMAGNALVLKHASNVSGVALAIENLFKLCGFPDGLMRAVLVKSERVEKLIEHPLVHAVTVTGSVQAGKAVAAKAGAMIKKTVLELGGSDAYIVLPDADLEAAAQTCAASRLINAGQSCVSAKRFIVPNAILSKFEVLFVEQMRQQVMGPPTKEGVTLGPLARHDLRDQLHRQVQESFKAGARLLLGGSIPDGPGAFYPPTVLSDVKPGMPAYHDEFFGPVASIIPVTDDKEAIRVANDTVFGLGAAVFTRDVERAEHIAAHELEAGCCFVNTAVKSDPRLPFGGIKESGYGRELSGFGIREFINIKTVYIQ